MNDKKILGESFPNHADKIRITDNQGRSFNYWWMEADKRNWERLKFVHLHDNESYHYPHLFGDCPCRLSKNSSRLRKAYQDEHCQFTILELPFTFEVTFSSYGSYD